MTNTTTCLRRTTLAIFLLLFVPTSHAANQDEDILRRLAGVTRTDRAKAIYIYNALDTFMTELGDQLSYIAESTDTAEEKDKVAEKVMADYFDSKDALVYVSTAPSNAIARYTVRVYLHNLARIREREGYTKVRLYFKPDYLGMGSLFSVYGAPNTYEISVSIIQIFIGEHAEFTYADETKKRLRIRFMYPLRRPPFKIHEILVLQTRSRPEMRSDKP